MGQSNALRVKVSNGIFRTVTFYVVKAGTESAIGRVKSASGDMEVIDGGYRFKEGDVIATKNGSLNDFNPSILDCVLESRRVQIDESRCP